METRMTDGALGGGRAAFSGGPVLTLGVRDKAAFSCQTLTHAVIINPNYPTKHGEIGTEVF